MIGYFAAIDINNTILQQAKKYVIDEGILIWKHTNENVIDLHCIM